MKINIQKVKQTLVSDDELTLLMILHIQGLKINVNDQNPTKQAIYFLPYNSFAVKRQSELPYNFFEVKRS